ncbi:MAG: formin-like protein 18 [Desulfovibrionaceae bacterium]|nr:formin-like protein 18 [Desulfovibrionaceae bacterium]MBF0513186.1 formin-like protein 18 [Desulfovibrionaceae bacterium]
MGQVLQIRVIAQTHRVEDAQARWPGLFALAFGPTTPVPYDERGVSPLVENIRQVIEFATLGKALSETMKPALPPVVAASERLEAALADWKPGEANKAAIALEDALDALEKLAPAE